MVSKCCLLVDELLGEIKDEQAGAETYKNLARLLVDAGQEDSAQIVLSMARDEVKHQILLQGLAAMLGERCNCVGE